MKINDTNILNNIFSLSRNLKKTIVISTDIIENQETSYEIKITKRNNQFIVTAHNTNKSKKITNKSARKILKHIVSAYRSEEVVKN